MTLKNIIIKTKDKLCDILYPNGLKCIFCGRDILNFEDRPYCDQCAKLELINIGHKCQRCDMKIKEGNIVCDFCGIRSKCFDQAFCPLNYEGYAKNSILKFKNDNARYLAKPFAKLIYQRLKENNIKIDIILAVPIHEKTRKKRGYNQSELLARELSVLLNRPYLPILEKNKQTQDQKKLPYRERLTNVEQCFVLKDKSAVKGKNVLIVDDVMTTCATLNEISKLLVSYADMIYVAAIARDNLQ